MAISIHPYLTGVPHRIKYLEMLYDYILGHEGVVMWTGAEILDWYRTQVPRSFSRPELSEGPSRATNTLPGGREILRCAQDDRLEGPTLERRPFVVPSRPNYLSSQNVSKRTTS